MTTHRKIPLVQRIVHFAEKQSPESLDGFIAINRWWLSAFLEASKDTMCGLALPSVRIEHWIPPQYFVPTPYDGVQIKMEGDDLGVIGVVIEGVKMVVVRRSVDRQAIAGVVCLHKDAARVREVLTICWREFQASRSATSRPSLDDVIVWTKDALRFKRDIEFFVEHRQWYLDRGFSWRRGYLLTGPAGNGKTSVARGLGLWLGVTPTVIDLTGMTNQALMSAFTPNAGVPGMSFRGHALRRIVSTIPPGTPIQTIEGMLASDPQMELSTGATNPPIDLTGYYESAIKIIVLEDLDQAFPKDLAHAGKGEAEHHVTMAGLLQALDGVAQVNGLIVIATTNKPEELDRTALTRRGRIDLEVEFSKPTPNDAVRYLTKLVSKDPSLQDEPLIAAIAHILEGHSFVTLREVLISAATIAHAAHREITPEDAIAAAKELATAPKEGARSKPRIGIAERA